MKKVKMLYFMHVPWGWIKQRPHFLAEELAKYFDITVVYFFPFNLTQLVKNNKYDGIKLKKLLKMPFQSKYNVIYYFNKYFVKLQLCKILKEKYELIWLTHPILFCYFNNVNKNIIYDCMDDALEFPNVKRNQKLYNRLFLLEKKLCDQAMFVICSSKNLKNKLINRYSVKDDKLKVINNGIKINNLTQKMKLPINIYKYFEEKGKKIVYIGTISEWFDFDIVLASLDIIPDIKYLLFGPAEISIPKHKNIIHCGPVKHEYVSTIMNLADVLVMPFKVTELIKSVNPVKVYEYIVSGKPSLVVEYDETEQFRKFVYLYSSKEDYLEKLKNILNGNLVTSINEEEKNAFLRHIDWQYKAEEIIKMLKKEDYEIVHNSVPKCYNKQ